MEDLIKSIVIGVITGAFSAGAIWGVLKTHIFFLRRDVDLAHTRITDHIKDYHRHNGAMQ